ncbi:MAG: ATP-binding protein [Flavobacteriales bacterium]|nr:ATP-binding protein [Flavobacteriales bacterium]
MVKSKEFIAHVDHMMSKSEIMDATSSAFVVVDENINVVYSNKEISDIKTLQPGDMLGCSNALELGCGKSKNCAKCVFRNTVKESFAKGVKVKKEAVLSLFNNSMLALKETAIPFTFNDKKYVVVFIVDVSAEKYKSIMEKTFSHYLVDMAGALDEYLKFMVESSEVDVEALKEAKAISSGLLDKIMLFRDVTMAQQGHLALNLSNMTVDAFLRSVSHKIQEITPRSMDKIEVVFLGRDVMMKTDVNLLGRIVSSMLKNAIENEHSTEKVILSVSVDDDDITFTVHNNTPISENVDGHVFQIGSTTQGEGRGIGTFGMKLIGENYLGGKVWFTSSEEKGTYFHVKIPIRR